jgi:hypothetical protein
MSPLSMAMVAAEVDSGSWHAPQFVEGSPPIPSGTALNPSGVSELHSLMRNAVLSGDGASGQPAGDAGLRPGRPGPHRIDLD